MPTIGNVLERHRGIGPGFDFLRISLALLILFTHSTDIVTGLYGEYADGPWQIPVRSLVPMFFALSGFLVTGSAQRLKLSDFILNRAMRIVPALAVDIIIAACIIGPIFTTLTPAAYVTSAEFWKYFTNIFGIIHYQLPGVFKSNINPNIVNGSLWTVPFEIGCYVIMSLLIFSGLINKRRMFAAIAAVFCVLTYAVAVAVGRLGGAVADSGTQSTAAAIIANFTTNKAGYYLYFYFLAGSLAHLFRERIPFRLTWFLTSIACFLAISVAGIFHSGLMLTKLVILIPFLTYATLYMGMLNIPKIPLYNRGDYSYGIYLYGFPIQQSLIAAFPNSFTILSHYLWSVIFTTSFAVFSWHCIEKPILQLRRKFSFTARKTERNERLPEPEMGSALSVTPAHDPAS